MTEEEKRALAGEYTLGLMDAAARRDFDRRAEADPELAAMAQALAGRMAALDATAAPLAHDPALWSRIKARLDMAPDTNVVPIRPARPPLSRLLLPLAASVLVALGIGYFTGTATRPMIEPTVIAVMLNQGEGTPSVIVEAYADDSVRLIPLERFSAPKGQILQVWTLPDPATGPVSLGTIGATEEIRLKGPNLPVPQVGQLYEITLEPAPGSPTGRPTGPVLVKGFAYAPVR
jgi:anti-sigma-K factor RskA